MIKRRENLAEMTVKALNALAKDMHLKGYSKLRKAELVEFIATKLDRQDAEAESVKILDVENPADHDTIAALIAEVATVTFSDASVESDVKPSKTPTLTETTPEEIAPSLEDLKAAYRNMRATVNGMRNTPARIKIVGRLRNLSSQLRAMGIKNPAYL